MMLYIPACEMYAATHLYATSTWDNWYLTVPGTWYHVQVAYPARCDIPENMAWLLRVINAPPGGQARSRQHCSTCYRYIPLFEAVCYYYYIQDTGRA